MATRNITDCIPQMQQSFEQAVKDYAVKFPNDPQPFLTCCFRDKIDQQKDYDQGRVTPGKIITNALPGQSLHNDYPSRAIDIAFKNKDGSLAWDLIHFKNFADCIKQYGAHWGGDWNGFKDYPHYEIPRT